MWVCHGCGNTCNSMARGMAAAKDCKNPSPTFLNKCHEESENGSIQCHMCNSRLDIGIDYCNLVLIVCPQICKQKINYSSFAKCP